jgi:hypothetical protein
MRLGILTFCLAKTYRVSWERETSALQWKPIDRFLMQSNKSGAGLSRRFSLGDEDDVINPVQAGFQKLEVPFIQPPGGGFGFEVLLVLLQFRRALQDPQLQLFTKVLQRGGAGFGPLPGLMHQTAEPGDANPRDQIEQQAREIHSFQSKIAEGSEQKIVRPNPAEAGCGQRPPETTAPGRQHDGEEEGVKRKLPAPPRVQQQPEDNRQSHADEGAAVRPDEGLPLPMAMGAV